jgi:hypothetical protein
MRAPRSRARRAAQCSPRRARPSGAPIRKELSPLYVLQYVAAAGNATHPGSFLRLIQTPGGAQERRFVGGSQVVSQRVADRLGKRVVPRQCARSRPGWRRRPVVAEGRPSRRRQAHLAVPPILAARPGLLASAAEGQGGPAAHWCPAPDEGRGRLPAAVLARRRPQRAGHRRRRPGQPDLRQLAAGRIGRRALLLHRRVEP